MPDQALDYFPRLDRRSILQLGAISVGAGIASRSLSKAVAEKTASGPDRDAKICIFAKPLQELDFQQLAEILSQWQVAGVEATVRKGGQIDPANAAEQLPRLFELLMAKERHYMILATDVDSGDHADVRRVLEVAAKLGIRYFRMAYYKYNLDQPILPQLEQFAIKAKSLAKVCASLNMTALYQNHAGADYVGAPVWDLLTLLRDIPKAQISVALDTRHTIVESTTAWPLAYEAIKDQVGSIFVKEAIVDKGNVKDVPLGTGTIAKQLFQRMVRDGIPGPLSLQMEHIDHRDPNLLPQRIEAIGRDIATLRTWLS